MTTFLEDYALYLRKSRKDDASEDVEKVLERHRKTLLKLAENQNLHIAKIYQEVVSGENIANRPEVQNLLRDVEKEKYAGVLVMEIERLARGDAIDQGIIQRTFSVTGTKIVTPIKTYDPNDEFDAEFFEFGLFRSRSEYKTISRRINMGRVASIKEGKYISPTAPYGYKRVKLENEKGWTLAFNEPECTTVKTIFELYVHGKGDESYGAYKIATYLDKIGLKPRVSDTWSSASIRDILKNEVYIGKIVWGKRKENKKMKDGEIVISRPTLKSGEYICVDGIHEPIVSEEVFTQAQNILKKHTKTSVVEEKKLMNPLCGFVYCEKCGKLMTRLGPNKKNKYDTLHCPNRYCDNISAPIFVIEDEVVSFLKEWLETEKLKLENMPLDQKQLGSDVLSSQIQSLSDELNGLHEQLEKTFELLEKGLYSEDVFLARQKKLSGDIASKEKTINELKKTLSKNQSTEKIRAVRIPELIKLIESYSTDATPEYRNDILNQMVNKIYYLKLTRNHKGTVDNRNFSLRIIPKFY